jgi:phage shock protein PspC (stress-responsive transcriptional regulator)
MPEDRTLRRSNDKMIAGVCGGLAEFFGWPADRFRIVYVVVSILSAGFPGTLVYLVLWLAMPPPEEGVGRRPSGRADGT